MPKGVPNKPKAAPAKRRKRRRRKGTTSRAPRAATGLTVTHAELGTIVGNAIKQVLAS